VEAAWVEVLQTAGAGVAATVGLILPGYVLGVTYSRGIPGPAVADRAFLAVSALGGLVVHLAGSWFTVPLFRHVASAGIGPYVWWVALWAATVLLVVPSIAGAALGILAEGRIPLTRHPIPRWLATVLGGLGLTVSVRTQDAWNWVFHRRDGAWVRVRRTDGTYVLGKLGDESFASSDPRLRDIYLEELWVADEEDWFHAPYPTSRGAWISGEGIDSIEFFEGVA